MVHLDSTNLKLLDLLQKDARTSIIDLARAVDRAESTVRERLAALERDGVLKGYRALVDPERLGYGARALLRAGCDRRRLPEVAKRLAAIPQVTQALVTTGAKPLTIEVVAENLARLEHILEERIAPLDLEDLEVDVVVRTLVEPRPLSVHAVSGGERAPEAEDGALPLAPLVLPRADPRARAIAVPRA